MTPSQKRRAVLDSIIASDYKAKFSIENIMERNGVGRQTIFNSLKRSGVELGRTKAMVNEEIRALALELREKAMKATPGPWHVGENIHPQIIYEKEGWAIANAVTYHGKNTAKQEANAEHIAACDPPTIIRLCNAVLGEETL